MLIDFLLPNLHKMAGAIAAARSLPGEGYIRKYWQVIGFGSVDVFIHHHARHSDEIPESTPSQAIRTATLITSVHW